MSALFTFSSLSVSNVSCMPTSPTPANTPSYHGRLYSWILTSFLLLTIVSAMVGGMLLAVTLQHIGLLPYEETFMDAGLRNTEQYCHAFNTSSLSSAWEKAGGEGGKREVGGPTYVISASLSFVYSFHHISVFFFYSPPHSCPSAAVVYTYNCGPMFMSAIRTIYIWCISIIKGKKNIAKTNVYIESQWWRIKRAQLGVEQNYKLLVVQAVQWLSLEGKSAMTVGPWLPGNQCKHLGCRAAIQTCSKRWPMLPALHASSTLGFMRASLGALGSHGRDCQSTACAQGLAARK